MAGERSGTARSLRVAATAPSLPQEAGRPRVQRLVDALPLLHLERDIPTASEWTLAVDGLVARPLRLSLKELATLPPAWRAIDFHCVWGWSRPDCRWEGISGEQLLDLCLPRDGARYALFGAAGSPYASCVRLEDVTDGILAWRFDGDPLTPEHGAPLRFVPPARLWAYKGVKWLDRVTFVERLEPGFWEAKVGDPEGRVPEAILALFEDERAPASIRDDPPVKPR